MGFTQTVPERYHSNIFVVGMSYWASVVLERPSETVVILKKKRLLERGFNQAVVLSKILSKQFDIKFDQQSLVRKIHTPMHRAGMDGKARALSVENAFEVMRPVFIRGEKILLVDDIYTSGATVSNCAKVLKESGADKVYAFTLAKTL